MRLTQIAILTGVAALTGCAGTATSDADPAAQPAVAEMDVEALPPTVGGAAANLAAQRFEKLKALEGDWVLPEGDGATQLAYEVTASGSAVVETVFPGKPFEMISVYTLDNGRLVMTHYCAMGNQPYMVAKAEGTPEIIRFECQKAGNTASHADAHMHLGVFTIGEGTLKTEWTNYAELNPGDTVGFELVRGGS